MRTHHALVSIGCNACPALVVQFSFRSRGSSFRKKREVTRANRVNERKGTRGDKVACATKGPESKQEKEMKEGERERRGWTRVHTAKRGRYSLVCYQQQVPVKQRSTNVSSSERAASLFVPSSSFSFFHSPACLPRTRFSIIDSLTRQDILLSDPRARYTPHKERSRGVLFIDVVFHAR